MSEMMELAERLTERQRSALIWASQTHPNVGGESFVTVDYTDPWTVPGIAQFLTLRTDRLTPLGIQLASFLRARHHLENSDAE